MAQLIWDTYGKTRVRLTYLQRDGGRHILRELLVKILFEGAFTKVFTEGDNTQVLPTDTMKNTVYALARQNGVSTLEVFARQLSRHFLKQSSDTHQVQIEIEETPWVRMGSHDAAFVQAGKERRTVTYTGTRESETIVSGVRYLQIIKTSGSAFSGYLKDQFTTLVETEDRLLGTNLEAEWRYRAGETDFDRCHAEIRAALLEAFANHKSLSVQHTMYDMAEKVLSRFEAVSEIHLTMPNKHCILVDLARLGLDNPNQIFMPIDEPSGYIEARLKR